MLIVSSFASCPYPIWQSIYGIISGIFTGTLGVGGVPAVLYADTQAWEPERFRLNMFSFFFLTGYVNVTTRYFAGQYTGQIVTLWFFALPFMFLGLWVGEKISKRVNKQQFQYLVLLLLVLLGGRLIYSVFS